MPFDREIALEPKIPTPKNSAQSSPRGDVEAAASSFSSPSRYAVTPTRTPPVSPALPVSPDFLDLPAPRSSVPPSVESDLPEDKPEMKFVSVGVGSSLEVPDVEQSEKEEVRV